MDFLFGWIGSVLIALPAYYKRKLSWSGFLAAVILGTLIYGLGTPLLWLVMIAFFLSSTVVSSKSQRKQERRGRTYQQVIANGGVALLSAALYAWLDHDGFLLIALIVFAGSNADTWGSEIGTKRKGKTFFITNLQQVPPGLSGGISLEGTLASAFGSMFIASMVVLYHVLTGLPLLAEQSLWQTFLLITGMGFLSTILDSYLGALVQAKYQVGKQGEITESNQGPHSRLVAGFRFINNDAVNVLSTLMIAIISGFFLLF